MMVDSALANRRGDPGCGVWSWPHCRLVWRLLSVPDVPFVSANYPLKIIRRRGLAAGGGAAFIYFTITTWRTAGRLVDRYLES